MEMGENEVRRIWKGYFEDLYDIDTQRRVSVHTCGLYGVQKDNYFGGEVIRTEVIVRVGMLQYIRGRDNMVGD